MKLSKPANPRPKSLSLFRELSLSHFLEDSPHVPLSFQLILENDIGNRTSFSKSFFSAFYMLCGLGNILGVNTRCPVCGFWSEWRPAAVFSLEFGTRYVARGFRVSQRIKKLVSRLKRSEIAIIKIRKFNGFSLLCLCSWCLGLSVMCVYECLYVRVRVVCF